MPQKFTLTIAVASDLHCHAEKDKVPRDSFLLAGARRHPAGKHPIQALVDLIRAHGLRADFIVCPGDLSNKICSSGMSQAWEHLREIQREMKSPHLLTTIGNHDVDSRKDHGPDPFEIPKSLHPEFPLPHGAEKDRFWSRGFYFQLDETVGADFVVLNTVIAHTDEATAKRGTFESIQISDLRDALSHRKSTIYDIKSVPHRAAVLHHHPLVHSNLTFGSPDVLQFGDQILRVLGEFGFNIVIHGHRHDPRITRVSINGVEQLVLAAGAFSAYLKELSSNTRNLFHILTLTADVGQWPAKGNLQTWEYNHGFGWRQSTTQSAAIPHEVGFMLPEQRPDFLDELCFQCDASPGAQLRDDELLAAFPQLKYMLPMELKNIAGSLLGRGYKLVVSPIGLVERCGKISRH